MEEEQMIPEDVGPKPQAFDLEQATRAGTHYRNVVWSGRHLQLTPMSIPVGGDIGLEIHDETDQPAARLKARALSRWEGEGGGLGPPLSRW
jgi:hypothetical protein